MNSKIIHNYFLLQGISILFLYGSFFVASDLLLIAGIPVSPIHVVSGFIIWFACSFLFSQKTEVPKNVFFLSTIITFALLFGLGSFFSSIYDTFYDSQWYHMDSIIHLHNNWNPFYRSLQNMEATGGAVYQNHFPIAPWLVAADIFEITSSIENAKSLTLFLTVGLFFISLFFFNRIFNSKVLVSVLLSFLSAANPISLLSSFSFYIDGQLSAFFTFTCIFFILFLHSKNFIYLLPAFLSALLLAHTKLTGSVYAIILCLAFIAVAIVFKAGSVKRLTFYFFAFILLTYAVLGFHPFVSNFIQDGNPLYPAVGKGSNMSIRIRDISPVNFDDKKRFEKFYLSFVSKPEWARRPDSAVAKKYFELTPIDHYADGVSDCGGWGPILPEILIILFPFLLLLFYTHRRSSSKWYYLLFILIILLTVFINPEAWLTRYVPQLWLVFITFLLVISKSKLFGNWVIHFALLFCLNNYIMFKIYSDDSIDRSNQMKKKFSEILPLEKKLVITSGWTNSFRYRMWEYGFDTTKFRKISTYDTTAVFIRNGMEAGYKLKKEMK